MAEIYVKSDLRKSSTTQVGELLCSTTNYSTYRHGNYMCVTYCPWLRGTGFIVHNFAQPLINDFADYKIPPLHETYENVLTVSYAMI